MKIRFKTSIQLRKLVGVILLVCGLQLYGQQTASGAEAEAKAATIITFDFPPSQGMASTGTQPQAINPAGAITGYYADAAGVTHGFLRAAPDGTLTNFDPPGSLSVPGSASVYTVATGINPTGAITGWYQDGNGNVHGFLRAPDGSFTIIDPPGFPADFIVAPDFSLTPPATLSSSTRRE